MKADFSKVRTIELNGVLCFVFFVFWEIFYQHL